MSKQTQIWMIVGGAFLAFVGLIVLGIGTRLAGKAEGAYFLVGVGWLFFLGGLLAFLVGLVQYLSHRHEPSTAGAAPTPSPPPVLPAAQVPGSTSSQGPGLQHSAPRPPGSPAGMAQIPPQPLVVLSTPSSDRFWTTVASARLSPDGLLVFCREPPNDVATRYGMTGATFWQIARNEGEGKVRPADLDRIGYLLEQHLGQAPGRNVVVGDLTLMIDDGSLRNVRRLLQVAREAAEAKRGRVIYAVNPEGRSSAELGQLTEGAELVRP